MPSTNPDYPLNRNGIPVMECRPVPARAEVFAGVSPTGRLTFKTVEVRISCRIRGR